MDLRLGSDDSDRWDQFGSGNERRRGRSASPRVIAPSPPSASHASTVDVPVNASWGLPLEVGEAVEPGVPPLDTGGLVLLLGALLPGVAVVVVDDGAGAALTTTVPCIVGCTLQWYAKVPA
jgi:hypothetical protein